MLTVMTLSPSIFFFLTSYNLRPDQPSMQQAVNAKVETLRSHACHDHCIWERERERAPPPPLLLQFTGKSSMYVINAKKKEGKKNAINVMIPNNSCTCGQPNWQEPRAKEQGKFYLMAFVSSA